MVNSRAKIKYANAYKLRNKFINVLDCSSKLLIFSFEIVVTFPLTAFVIVNL